MAELEDLSLKDRLWFHKYRFRRANPLAWAGCTPPLDGSTVLANLHKGYARMIRNVQDPRMFLVGFIVLLLVLESSSYGLFDMAGSIAGPPSRTSVGPWCSELHHSTEK